MRFTPFVVFISFSLSLILSQTHTKYAILLHLRREAHTCPRWSHILAHSLLHEGEPETDSKHLTFPVHIAAEVVFSFHYDLSRLYHKCKWFFCPCTTPNLFLSGSFEDALRTLLRAPLNLIDCGNIEFLPLVITLLYSSCVPCPAFRTLYPPFHSLRSHDLLVTVVATVVWGLGGCAAAASLRE